jgi:hypothetical protein
MKGVHAMNISRLFLVVSFALLTGLPLSGQTPGEEIAKLKARVKELEAENEKLKQAVAKNGPGSLDVSLGQLVTIEGVGDNTSGPKSLSNFKVDTVNGKKLEKPLLMHVGDGRWDGAKRYVFKGYETLIQLGVPDAINEARREAGQPPLPVPGAAFGFHSRFNVLSVVSPKEVKGSE